MNRETLNDLYYGQNKRLRQIGKEVGKSGEWVRLQMIKCHLPRITKRGGLQGPRYQNVDDFFAAVKNTGCGSITTLRKLLFKEKQSCNVCGNGQQLRILSKRLPPLSLSDIEIICAACHQARNEKGNNNRVQLEICDKYAAGKKGRELAKEYGVHPSLIYAFLKKHSYKVRARGTLKSSLT